MRLLHYDNDGDFRLTEFFEADLPKYAILSHTWGAEEVTFKDLIRGKGKSNAGYRKIKFCGEQATRDGLHYFWVDTCCIDKSSSVELFEAINSMFHWFRRAAKCYVYLADVLTHTFDANDPSSERPWELAFRNSRWFTRGWTLQELLAPQSVEFFSREGERLGDKRTLAQEIHETTGIPVLALEGTPLSEFSIDERMSWFSNRNTARSEDKVYSVLGLFNVFMPIIYGEGEANAMRRLLEKIARRPSLWQEKDVELNIDAGCEASAFGDVESIFSDSGMSMSSKSSVVTNSVQVSGIREVARALLSSDGFMFLCTTAVSNVAPRKTRLHIRGFLKNYGQQLDREASSQLQHQAARFVQEVAGRLADEIRWSIIGFDEVNEPADTGVEKQNLEKWLSNVEKGMNQVNPKSGYPDQLIDDGDESDDEPDVTVAFPSIDAVREFLLSSNAFAELNQALDHWVNLNKRLTNKERAVSIPEVEQNIDLGHAINEGTLADTPASVAFDLPETSISNSFRTEQQYLSNSTSQSVGTLISGLLDFWGVSFFVYDLLELLVPPVPIGFERVRWRCSCNTVLWGDFPVDDSGALNNLKQDLFRNVSLVVNNRRNSHTKKTPASQQPYSLPTDQTSASVRATDFSNSSLQTARAQEGAAGSTSSGRFSPITELNAPSNEIGAHPVSLTEVTVDKCESTYFEVCTNVGNFAVGHFEIDISKACTDGELFEKIWDIYNQSRGFGIRRLFLRPRDVHFVMFSISNKRAAQYSAGIHKKPEEYPPDEELQQQRYHYFSPKIVMPGHVFIHFLHRARWNVWGEHADDTWLKRLPKKLNQSILAAQAANGNSDLVFGWGVHILDGPNHAVLGIFLAFGLMITFVISCLIAGVAKTQEQAFGVGQYFVAIIVSLMSAMYFKLQDQ